MNRDASYLYGLPCLFLPYNSPIVITRGKACPRSTRAPASARSTSNTAAILWLSALRHDTAKTDPLQLLNLAGILGLIAIFVYDLLRGLSVHDALFVGFGEFCQLLIAFSLLSIVPIRSR